MGQSIALEPASNLASYCCGKVELKCAKAEFTKIAQAQESVKPCNLEVVDNTVRSINDNQTHQSIPRDLPESPIITKPSPMCGSGRSQRGNWAVNERATLGLAGFREVADLETVVSGQLRFGEVETKDGPLRCDHPSKKSTLSTQSPLSHPSTQSTQAPLSVRKASKDTDFSSAEHASTSSELTCDGFLRPGDSTCVCGNLICAHDQHCLVCGRDRSGMASNMSGDLSIYL